MRQIEHDPNDTKPLPRVWPYAFGMFAVLIVGGALTRDVSWPDFLLGVGAGGILAGWAIEKTGNKWPWSSPRGRDRNP